MYMETFGQWILITFALYYIFALMTGSKNVIGCLVLGAILSLGIVLI